MRASLHVCDYECLPDNTLSVYGVYMSTHTHVSAGVCVCVRTCTCVCMHTSTLCHVASLHHGMLCGILLYYGRCIDVCVCM